MVQSALRPIETTPDTVNSLPDRVRDRRFDNANDELAGRGAGSPAGGGATNSNTRVPDRELEAVRERHLGLAFVADEDAVGAAGIAQPESRRRRFDHRVVARHAAVLEDDHAVVAAPDRHAIGGQGNRLSGGARGALVETIRSDTS